MMTEIVVDALHRRLQSVLRADRVDDELGLTGGERR